MQIDAFGLRAKGMQPSDPGAYRIYAANVHPPCSGDLIAEVGNSGNSGEPHLHIHAQRPGPPAAPLGGEPLPITLGGRSPVRGDRIELP